MTSTQSLDQIYPITYSVNSQQEISLAKIPIKDLAKEFGTPLYLLCEQTIRTRMKAYRQAFQSHPALVLYASKALNCKALCAIAKQENLGIDVVSLGELYTALLVDFPRDKIFFHGNNKSQEEIDKCIDEGIHIVIDNFHDIQLLQKSSIKKSTKLLLRVRPGIECHTHDYIKTGKIDSKFGFALDEIESAIEAILKLNHQITGLHGHIGSQIFETLPHQDICKLFMQLYKNLSTKYKIEFEDINIGGGLGIKYTQNDDPPSINEWSNIISQTIAQSAQDLGLKIPRILVEPGRSIVAPAGLTVYTIGNIKNIEGVRKYLCVDGGMADNPRYIMYQACYTAQIDGKVNNSDKELVTIAGKYCESGDILIKDTILPKAASGELLVVFATGAYNYSMSSNYNRSLKPALVLLNDSKASIIVERENLDDLVSKDRLPNYLKD